MRPPEGVVVGRYGAGNGDFWAVDRKSEMFYRERGLEYGFLDEQVTTCSILYLITSRSLFQSELGETLSYVGTNASRKRTRQHLRTQFFAA